MARAVGGQLDGDGLPGVLERTASFEVGDERELEAGHGGQAVEGAGHLVVVEDHGQFDLVGDDADAVGSPDLQVSVDVALGFLGQVHRARPRSTRAVMVCSELPISLRSLAPPTAAHSSTSFLHGRLGAFAGVPGIAVDSEQCFPPRSQPAAHDDARSGHGRLPRSQAAVIVSALAIVVTRV